MSVSRITRIVLMALASGLIAPGTLAQSWGGPTYLPPYPYQPVPVYYAPPVMPAYQPGAYRVTYTPVYPGYRPYGIAKQTTLQQKETSPSVVPGKRQKTASIKNKKPTDTKQKFVDSLLPFIARENQRLRQQRQRLSGLFSIVDNGGQIDEKQLNDLKQLAKRYRVDGDLVLQPEARHELLEKVDVIPASLALAQAANESGWGKSRFATEANNLFGIWTYDKNLGLKPLQRSAGKTHLVRKFDDRADSIAYYMKMLNSHPAYARLREIRSQARRSGRPLTGLALAEGLQQYSAKGEVYIRLIQQLIEQNRWSRLDQPAA